MLEKPLFHDLSSPFRKNSTLRPWRAGSPIYSIQGVPDPIREVRAIIWWDKASRTIHFHFVHVSNWISISIWVLRAICLPKGTPWTVGASFTLPSSTVITTGVRLKHIKPIFVSFNCCFQGSTFKCWQAYYHKSNYLRILILTKSHACIQWYEKLGFR